MGIPRAHWIPMGIARADGIAQGINPVRPEDKTTSIANPTLPIPRQSPQQHDPSRE